ncbi:MAG: hypothetical protein WD097_05670 [Balneolales bacterium]
MNLNSCYKVAGTIRKHRLRCVVLLWIAIMPGLASAQFLRLTLEVESELAAEEVSPLRFGEVMPNTGVIRIPIGDPDMGTYSISGPQNLMVNLSVDLPENLEMTGETVFQVPAMLEVAYANRNENNVDHAIPISGGEVKFQLREDGASVVRGQPAPSATAFIYVYGEVIVDEIPPGIYNAEVNIEVEYE